MSFFAIDIMVEEKRASSRYSYSGSVAYKLHHVTINGSLARNISLGGISLKVHGFVPMGAVIELELCLGTNQVVWVKAQVVRIREISAEDCYELGLKFVETEGCRKAIAKYIEETQTSNTKTEELKSHG